jgi:hypothetical protein
MTIPVPRLDEPFEEWLDRVVLKAMAEQAARAVQREEDWPVVNHAWSYPRNSGQLLLVVSDKRPWETPSRYCRRLLCRVRMRLDQLGLEEVACAEHPPGGGGRRGSSVVLFLTPYTDDLARRAVAAFEEEVQRMD